MKFCPWYPLIESAAFAPLTPNIWQVRLASGLLHYPNGKSAMLHYQFSEQRAAQDIAAFAQAHPARASAWLCRHLVADDEQGSPLLDAPPREFYDTLLAQFVARFGQMPQVTQEWSERAYAWSRDTYEAD